jgi:quercetin dioxygenase-like cupin family protein
MEIEPITIEGGAQVRRVITKKNHNAHLVFSLVVEEPGKGHLWHVHPGDEVIFIMKGEGTLSFVDENGTEKHLKAKEGHVVFVPLGLRHQFINTGTESMMLVVAIAPPHT